VANLTPAQIRSIALVGHGAAGKTTLVEALLAATGAIKAKGSVEKGSTVCDSDPLEKEIGHSLNSALVSFELSDKQSGVRVYLADTPGYPDFAGQAIGALAAADTALITINAQTGIELNTERMMKWAGDRGLCRMIVVNKIDCDNLDLPKLVGEIRERFGKQCMLLDLPAHNRHDVVEVLGHDSGDADFESVAAAHRALIDQIVEEDEELLARYLEEGADPSPDELHAPFEKALREGHLIPILFVSAKTGAGIPELLEVLAKLAPNPAEGNPPPFWRGELGGAMESFPAEPDPASHVLAHVFKVVIDPYMGKIGIFRVHQGTVKKEMQLFVGDGKKPFKVAHLYRIQGAETLEVNELLPGEIGAVAKVDEIAFDCVLHDSHDEDYYHLAPAAWPQPVFGLALMTTQAGRRAEALRGARPPDGRGPLPRGQLRSAQPPHRGARPRRAAPQDRARGAFHALEPAARHRHAEHPLPRDDHRGGRGTLPPQEAERRRRPVRRGRAARRAAAARRRHRTRRRGQGRHDPDQLHARGREGRAPGATMEAIRNAQPIVLEPVVEIEILSPENAIGDLTGDLAGKRGHVTGTGQRGGMTAISGQVPLAELTDYQSRLKSLTGGQGSYHLALSHYAQVPPNVQQQLMGQHKTHDDEE
jgi:elongation factor G